jgi:hypothetical protein
MRNRAGRRRVALEISAERVAYVHAVNLCYYQTPVPEMVERILATPELAEGWKRMFGQKGSLKSASWVNYGLENCLKSSDEAINFFT